MAEKKKIQKNKAIIFCEGDTDVLKSVCTYSNMKQSLLEENMHRLDLLIHAIHKLNWLQMWCVSRDNIKHILSIYKGLPHFNLT